MKLVMRFGLVFLCVLSFSMNSFADHHVSGEATAQAAQAAEMAKWQALASPNEHHKVLASLVGEWTYSIAWKMEPKGNVEKSQGTSSNRLILGNRFLEQTVKGESMGQPFEGFGTLGYDNIREEYRSVWIDNMSTSMMLATSQYDAKRSTFNESGTMSCPMTGEKDRPFRAQLKLIDRNHYTYDFYVKDKDGREFKSMSLRYQRVK